MTFYIIKMCNSEFNKIKSFLAFFVMLQIFTSCLCFRKTPPAPPAILITQKDSTYTTIVYKDTTIQIRLPPDTIYSVDTIYIKPGNILSLAPKFLNKGIITATAFIRNNKLYLSAYLNDSTYYYPIKNAIRSTTTNNIRSTAAQLPTSSPTNQNQLNQLIIIILIIIIAALLLYFLFKTSK